MHLQSLIYNIILVFILGGKIDGPAFYQCTNAREHSNHHGSVRSVEFFVYGLQFTSFDSLCSSAPQVARSYPAVGHGGEILLWFGLDSSLQYSSLSTGVLTLQTFSQTEKEYRVMVLK